MKLFALTLALAACTVPSALVAQKAPPPDKPAPPPAAPPPPATADSPGLLPPPSTPPAEVPDSFKSDKERQSYALGSFFAAQEKSNASMANLPTPNGDELLAGLKDVLGGSKSTDYVAGATIGVRLRRLELDVDQEVLFQAMREALAGQQLKLSTQQQQMVLQRIQTELTSKATAKKKAETEKALAAANEFLATNAKAEGVTQGPGGLQYNFEKPGEGKSASEGDMVTMNYRATLSDGTEFEKSPPTGPARKPVKMLPNGVKEALTILKTGGKGKFWVPPALAVGGTPGVKQNAVLIYDIELLSVEPLPKPATIGTPTGRPPVTAVTPPITVEIPPKPEGKDAPKTPPPPAPDAPKPPAPPPPPPVPPQDNK